MDNASAYEDDFYAWAMEQARLLRAGALSEADVANIADEIEGMGRGERRELVNRLAVLLLHLLRWQVQPALRGNAWRLTIREQRRKLARHLDASPSLRAFLGEATEVAYGDALLGAQRETGLPERAFPPSCPYDAEQILGADFLPGQDEA